MHDGGDGRTATQRRWLNVLSSAECLELLATGNLGRVGVSIGGLPAILPVVYRLTDGCVWFFTEDGTKLTAAVRNAVVAFEVDHLDADGGWSVLIVGECSEETSPEVIRRLRAEGLTPGAPGPRDHLVSIPIRQLSGRAFSTVEQEHVRTGYL